jgi:hypothetical protein
LADFRRNGLEIGFLFGEERRQDADCRSSDCRMLGWIRWLALGNRARDKRSRGQVGCGLARRDTVELVFRAPGRDHRVVQRRVHDRGKSRLAVRALLLGSRERECELVPALRCRHGAVELDRRVGDRRSFLLKLS